MTNPELDRAIGVTRATAMVVGTIIGASIFVQPALVSGAMRSTPGVLLVWTVAGLLSLIGALIAAELASAFPRSGGVYVFLRDAYGPALGYLWGWAMFWSMHSGIIAAIATVCARYVGHFVELGDAGTRAVAVAVIVTLSVVNHVGVRHGSALQTLFTIVKVGAVLLIVVTGIAYLSRAPSSAAAGPSTHWSTAAFVPALVAGLFAYGGWHMVTYAAGETRDPRRTIPRALTMGMVVVTVAYIAINAAYLAVLPADTVASSSRIAADFADAVLGSGGGDLLSALVIVSALGGLTGIILAGPRVYHAMAQDRLLFAWAGAIHPRHRTPHVAIALQALWSSVLVLTGTYRALFTRVVYTEWIFFALMAASIYFLRRRGGYAPLYRVPWYPLLATIFNLSSVGIVIHQAITSPAESLTGLGLVAAGLPVYWFWTRRRSPAPAATAAEVN